MEFRYFVEANNALSQLREDLTEEEEKEAEERCAFAKRHGGEVCFGTSSHIIGIAISTSTAGIAETPKGFKLDGVRDGEGERYRVFTPNKRTKIGRQAAIDMKALIKESFSTKAIRKLGLGNAVFEGRLLYFSGAFISGGEGIPERLAVRVPISVHNEELSCPEGMIEIKKSSWVALTEEGLDIPELKV